MPPSTEFYPHDFVDRRDPQRRTSSPPVERRQFADGHESLSDDARELASAIESYKMHHRRRFVTYEEMLSVVKGLGYHKG